MRSGVLVAVALVGCGAAPPVVALPSSVALRVRAVVGAHYVQTTTIRVRNGGGETISRLSIDRRILAVNAFDGVMEVESVATTSSSSDASAVRDPHDDAHHGRRGRRDPRRHRLRASLGIGRISSPAASRPASPRRASRGRA